MVEQVPVLVRMRDVGVSLRVAQKFERGLTRIQIQKFIYLLDIAGMLFDLLPPSKAHLTYKYGPYDVAIQDAVDSLAFRGIVAVCDIQRSNEGIVRARYKLTSEGDEWVEQLLSASVFTFRWQAASIVGAQVEDLGWDRLVDLVYAEPTFVSRRNRGYGQSLPLNDGLENSAAFFIASFKRVLGHGFDDITIDQKLIVDLFFKYLSEYDHIRSDKISRR